MGFRPVRDAIQLDEMDSGLRTGLWNALQIGVLDQADVYNQLISTDDPVWRLLRMIWMSLFKRPLDSLSRFWQNTYQDIRRWFFAAEWYEVYDFVEFVVQNYPSEDFRGPLATLFNSVLAREMSGYRFVDLHLVPITSPGEIDSIESALQSGNAKAPHIVHLTRALALLADRQDPDYRNSIKESISAVEAACQTVAKKPGATLSDALKALERNRTIHPALKEAFLRLYGWTSDADGIRHALTEEPGADQSDALFMLVTCSAFINYLVGKMPSS